MSANAHVPHDRRQHHARQRQLAIIIPKLREIGARIDPSQLHASTPCKDFTVAGVLRHMTGLASAFAPMFRGDQPPSGNAEPDETTEIARIGNNGRARVSATLPMPIADCDVRAALAAAGQPVGDE